MNRMIKHLVTYFRYFFEYLKHGDFMSVIYSIKYMLFRTSHGKDRIIKTTIGIFFCRKNTNDFQFANYKYEWGVKKYLLENLDSYSVFIDGGACVGDYSILLARHNKRCIAFEPVTENFKVLVKNMELNIFARNGVAIPYGLGDRNYTADFVFNPVNTGASHLAQEGDLANCQVEIRTFDSILPSLNIAQEDHILVKLDLESMELEALRGAETFIRQYPNITFVIEDRYIRQEFINNELSKLATFEFGIVDEFNIFAKKIKQTQLN
ncbi:MAG: FkbM family methyltransferase [Bacteroidetes bacterium]|nr:FkbM family methyltransferase [Bacteroidota bacterium]